MNFEFNFILDTYSIVILLMILFSSARQLDRDSFVNKLFNNIVVATIIILFFDILGRLDGTAYSFLPVLNIIGNFFLFALNLVAPSLWLMYAHYQVYFDEKRTLKISKPLIVLNIINIIMVIVSQFTGIYYSFNPGNIYVRGPLYFIPFMVSTSLLIVTFLLIIFNREKIDKKRFLSLSSFSIPPLICSVLHFLIYGYSFVLSGIVISLLVIYLNIQNQNIYTDYITSLHNRRGLERYLKEKSLFMHANDNFGGIMLDIDHFKAINDEFGHSFGDMALAETASLLKSVISEKDMVARYGGDEFFIIINSTDEKSLKLIVSKIIQVFEKRNQNPEMKFPLTLSIGYDIYYKNRGMTIVEFQDSLDKLMYNNKFSK